GRHPSLTGRQRRHVARAQYEVVRPGVARVAQKLSQRLAEGAGEANHHVERQTPCARLDLLDVPIFQTHHPPDLLGPPAAALAQRAELPSDDLRAAVFAVALGEESGEAPVLAR